jgi:fused signal recognition particle receptor
MTNIMETWGYVEWGTSGFFALAIILWPFWKRAFGLKRSKAVKSGVEQELTLAKKVKKTFQAATKTGKELASLREDLEEILLEADVGITETEKLLNDVFEVRNPKSVEEAYQFLKEAFLQRLSQVSDSDFMKDLWLNGEKSSLSEPVVVYLVGVNGVGKTTTIGKLALRLKKMGMSVMTVAADTFRAAAVEQLKVWAERNDVKFVGGQTGADPSSVIVDGLQSAKAKGVDVVLVDTAGRLHNKSNLMDELRKMARMCEKVLEKKPDEVLLVIDAMTGQNGYNQAKVFLEAADVSGIVLSKYDASAKGGVILPIMAETGIPMRFVGLGEGVEDLKPFQPEEFVQKIFPGV